MPFGMSWGSIAGGLVAGLFEGGIGLATGGVGFAAAPLIGAGAAFLTGSLVNHEVDHEKWSTAIGSGALDGGAALVAGPFARLAGKMLGGVAAKLGGDELANALRGAPRLSRIAMDTVDHGLRDGSMGGGEAFNLMAWSYSQSGKLVRDIGSAAGAMFAHQAQIPEAPPAPPIKPLHVIPVWNVDGTANSPGGTVPV